MELSDQLHAQVFYSQANSSYHVCLRVSLNVIAKNLPLYSDS